MKISDFDHTIDFWIREIEKYSFPRLLEKPSPVSWSLGQVCMHLLEDTRFYLDQIEICINTNDHRNNEPSLNGRVMLTNNDFPDDIIEGAPSNARVRQPESKDKLLRDLQALRTEMNLAATRIIKSPFRGKAKHPGLGYFNADEWLQFAEMHLRHHLRQKKRIDELLALLK